ncbi:double-strand break repair protein AddB [Rubellimicrobium sp. CFH 75288]|uniref:double-strand break repair protein AddB n=1 Tax=Rubellimicrobium sp. CFH 75288 TaxID=2697034 RepID=UPI0014125645|nr:double-strand break repair protein AddB [Rubellimicrobium sp. CFH 75288]NAZ37787.1 double-strand break repair protein AddB [Rubellimicrobium sp. CFH 75288]
MSPERGGAPVLFPEPGPRLFRLAPGRDLPEAVAAGLAARLVGAPAEAWGRITVYVPTSRLLRRLREALSAGGARILPRLRLVSDIALDPAGAGLPPPVPALRRRLELAQLVAALLERETDLAPRARIYELADSLADLMEEMQGEGVPPSALSGIDVGELSGHWERALRFLRILEPWFGEEGAPDGEGRIRAVVERLTAAWAGTPPQDPVLLAGADGEREATLRLMEAVARLPQGAVLLHGFDEGLPPTLWEALTDPLANEDHPQHRFACLLRRLGVEAGAVRPWSAAADAPSPRERLLSLALRPPPVTDQWIAEGPSLGDLREATAGLTLLEAPLPRLAAEAAALGLRDAAARGLRAALVTPDRGLARAVTAALARWDIRPDDSAGEPLGLSPPGRLLRQVARLRTARATGEDLLALLKHPLCHAGAGRPRHLARAQALELRLRRRGPAFPDREALETFGQAGAEEDPGLPGWAGWVAAILDRADDPGPRPLAAHLSRHLALADLVAAGPDPREADDLPLWAEAAGREARRLCETLRLQADAGGVMDAFDYALLFDGILDEAAVRDPDRGDPRILIWGPREARAGGADRLILAGLEDGSWPAALPSDPWLNRRMREQVGLPLPERRIGSAALDFTIAASAPEVWLLCRRRSDEAPLVPSRWLVRLLNLVEGLTAQHGPEAADAMRARGRIWLRRAERIGLPSAAEPPAERPCPCPPLAARPSRLSVTAIERLLSDPYAVYASEVLRLRPLDPLRAAPDGALRGQVLHRALERFVAEPLPPCDRVAAAALLARAAEALEAECPWPAARRLWLAALARAAPAFLEEERQRRASAAPHLLEVTGEIVVSARGQSVTVVARADRIDVDAEGRLYLFDYKTGEVPSAADQLRDRRQLLLTAALAARGAFAALGPRAVAGAQFLGLGHRTQRVAAPLAQCPPEAAWADLVRLVEAWADPERGYASRLRVKARDGRDYDHLARFGEWDGSLPARPQPVG